MVSGLRLLGRAPAVAGEAAGLVLLAGGDGLSHPTARQAQAPPSKQCLPTAEVHLCISLQGLPDIEPVVLPLRVRAGAPHALHLLPGNPWEEAGGDGDGDGETALALQHGGSLPPFQVAVFDVWGNPTAPSADLGFAVLAECGATRPQALEFTPDALGIATVEGAPSWAGQAACGCLSVWRRRQRHASALSFAVLCIGHLLALLYIACVACVLQAWWAPPARWPLAQPV